VRCVLVASPFSKSLSSSTFPILQGPYALLCHFTQELTKTKATIYWSHIGRVIFAATNEQLAQLTGPGNKENFTMKWHTRDILLDQQKDIEVIGPVEGMDKVVMKESDVYWRGTRA
jgi:hypothetical protein